MTGERQLYSHFQTMKRTASLFWIVLATLACCATTATAQFGVGAGLAAVGDNVGQAGGELRDLLNKDSITYEDVSGDIGFYVSGRARFELGILRLLGDVSYVYFQSPEITLTDAAINAQDSTVNATFEVGTSMIPIQAGIAVALPIPVVKPYLGMHLGYTFVSRTYTFVSGSDELERLDLQNKSAGDPEFGLAFSGGIEIGLGFATLDIGARYNLANVFTIDDDEQSMRYLQVGASLMLGGGL